MSVATAKAIIYAIQQLISDEKTRKNVFYMIAIPVVIIILLTSMINYMFTMPLEMLAEYFTSDYDIAVSVVDEYGYEYGYVGDGFVIGDYSNYDAIDNVKFSALMNEATKYIGRPYVWGGSTPSSGFDCSGFICWSYTKSQVYNLPRTTAQGVFDQCIPIPREEAKAGDLVFFEKTYASTGDVSHIGIYLGDGKMLHCGDPIGYASIDTAYWQQHFYAFGRLPQISETAENTL